jgi:hypothetical protein
MKYLELIVALFMIITVTPPALSVAAQAFDSIQFSIHLMNNLSEEKLKAGHFLAFCDGSEKEFTYPLHIIPITETGKRIELLSCTLRVLDSEIILYGVRN